MTLHVGIIGAGFIAERHFTVLRSQPDVVIQAVSNPSLDRSQALPAMLEAEHPDAVFLCVSPFVHGPPEMELVERGIPFLVEKP